jgi:hypothetical protein
LKLLQLKQSGGGFALKAKGTSGALAALQGGAVGARLVLGNECFAVSAPCVKKGKGLRCK